MSKTPEKKNGWLTRCLNGIERVGNALPHPVTLFAIFALAVIVISALCAALGVSATGNLISGGELKETTVTAVSLLTIDGLAYMFTSAVKNFTNYAPLGMVLVAMLGVGVAEKSGITKKDAERVVNATFETIAAELKKSEKVQLSGFGIFELKAREARVGRNPHTREAIQIPATKVPTFKPSKVLKESVE